MKALSAAIHARLKADATLVGLLGEYQGEPAIFTFSPVPEDAEVPYVVVGASVADVPFDAKDMRGREITRDLLVVSEEVGDSGDVDDIAERVRTLLHRVPLVVAGWGTVLTQVAGPVEVPSDERLYGRLLTLRVVLTS